MNETISTRMILEIVKDKKGRLLAQKEFISEITFNCKKILRTSYFLIKASNRNEVKYGETKQIFNKRSKVTRVDLISGKIS